MSNPTCFLSDIYAIKVGDMECMDIVKSEEGLEPQEENQKVEKLKEAHLLLKKKLTLSHELIKQYNDKVKECQQIGNELETVKENLKKLTLKHNSCLSTIAKLELENEDYKQKVDSLEKIIPEQETKIAADKQHLQQLICRVKELEQKEMCIGKTKKDDVFKDKIKTLESELKLAKESHRLEIKQMEIKLAKSNRITEVVKNQSKKKETVKISNDKSTCTFNELETIITKVKPETTDKSTLTDEFYSIKDDPYPLFCSKCIIRLDPVPFDQILKQMTSCPTMITEVPSPCKESEIKRPRTPPRVQNRMEKEFGNEVTRANNINNNFNQSMDSIDRNLDVSKSDFERLEKKISSLERKLHKKTKKDIQGMNPCCGGGFPYPNNCYLGPYPNLFQPGAMIRTQNDIFQYKNWEEGFRKRKRSRKVGLDKLNRRGTKLRKKRKLEDGTSEWNIDSVPIRESVDSDNRNISENHSEPFRKESGELYSCEFKSNGSERREKNNESFSPLRKKKGDERATTLFSRTRTPSPKLQDDIEEKYFQEMRNDSSKLVNRIPNEIISDEEEMIESDKKIAENFLEYETIECVPKKRGRPPKNAGKTSSKHSLVTKIRNLKKNCNKIKPLASKIASASENTKKSSANQNLDGVNELRNSKVISEPIRGPEILNFESTADYCLAKKHRIAHSARKSENESSHERNDENSSEVQEIIKQKDSFVNDNNLRIDTSTESLSKNIEPADTDSAKRITVIENGNESLKDQTPNDEKNVSSLRPQPFVMIPKMYSDIAEVEYPRKEVIESEINRMEREADESGRNLTPNIERMLIKDAPLRILRSKTKTIKSSDKDYSSLKNDGEDIIDKNSTLRIELTRCVDNVHHQESSDNEIDSVKCDKSEEVNKGILEIDKSDEPTVATVRKYKRRTRIIRALPVSPMRELRSRRIILSPKENLQSEVKSSVTNGIEELKSTDERSLIKIEKVLESEGLRPRDLFEKLLIDRNNSEKNNSCNKNVKVNNSKLQKRKENLVMKELSKLCEDPEWKKALLSEVIERLLKFKTHTIAKCTIDFLVSKAEDDEELDRTHTPPAPLLSKTQQRIVTLLVVLNRTIPNLVTLVQAGIEFRLFRLGHAPEVNVVEELSRVFTALSRIQKDREKVRILCCDALYCLGLKAMPVIYVVLVSWPEVFPMKGSSSDPLVLSVIDSIMTKTGDTKFPKFFALKKLFTGYYGYESSGYVTNDLAKTFMNTLRDKRENGLDTAMIIMCKKKGPVWTYENVIQGGLLQMIIQKAHPSTYDAFCLLGHLMRSFPIDDKNGLVKNILEQLCALMESGEGSMEQQEGVATALLSLSRHSQNVVTNTILNWEPSGPVSQTTSRQLIGLFDNYPTNWWRNKLSVLRKKCTKIS